MAEQRGIHNKVSERYPCPTALVMFKSFFLVVVFAVAAIAAPIVQSEGTIIRLIVFIHH